MICRNLLFVAVKEQAVKQNPREYIMKLLSIIVPCYNEEAALPYFLPEIQKTVDELFSAHELDTEILFINDGSRDGTLELLRTYAKAD